MPLYGAVPFLRGHDMGKDVGLAWLNSAETFVDIFENSNQKRNGAGLYTSFTSEGGAMEFWLLGSTRSPKVVSR